MITSFIFTTASLVGCMVTAHAVPFSTPSNAELPIVDLGYELHQASFHNSTGGFYNFSNIRYGAPPVGPLRWNLPQQPATNRSEVQRGSQGRICPQASGAWIETAGQFIPEYLAGKTLFNSSDFEMTNSTPVVDPRETEDCLFMDIVVPQDVYDSRNDGYGAPVLVWIHGGGYALGSKSDSGDASGLIARSNSTNVKGVVYVSFNYRLGAFGFLGGPSVQANGTANAGLHDQRLALQWIQENIHLFGGDPSKVTVFGESAGGGSIMAHITAYGGKEGAAPFAQAIIQSPAFLPSGSASQQEDFTDTFLSALGVTSIEEARQLSQADLYAANAKQIGNSQYGRFTFTPSIDGDFIPDLPGRLLANGLFDKSVRVMTAHNSAEGLLFTSPHQQNNTAFKDLVLSTLPSLAGLPNAQDYIVGEMYPARFNGTETSYTDQIARASLFNSELVFTCNTFYLNKAFQNHTHSYLFSASNGIHSADVPYTYYTGAGEAQPSTSALAFGGVTHPVTALVLQQYITSFALTGNPNSEGVPYLPQYGQNATVIELNGTDFTLTSDPSSNARCEWFQQGLFA